MSDHEQLSEELVRKCLKKGAGAAEVYLRSAHEVSVDVRNGAIETVKEASSSGLGIRIFTGRKMGFASSNDLAPASLDRAVEKAVSFARIMVEDKANVLPEATGETRVDGLFDPDLGKVPLDKKIDLARTAEKMALKDARITKSDGAGYSQTESEVWIANSNGLLQGFRSSVCRLGVAVIAEKDGQKSPGGEYCSRRSLAALDPPEKIAGKAAENAVRMLGPKSVKTQKAPVIFDREVTASLLGGIISAMNGEKVSQGASFLAGRTGQSIAVEQMTLVDDGTMAGGLGSAPFDDEGVPTARRIMIDRGVLRGFMYNTAAAVLAGTKSTGNASRSGYDGLPEIGPHNFYMEAGQAKRADILASTPRGLLVTELTGYGINPVSGNFSGGVSGFWIEDGRIVHPVIGLTVAGSAEEILKGIDAVADDLDRRLALAAPTIRVRGLQIGGD